MLLQVAGLRDVLLDAGGLSSPQSPREGVRKTHGWEASRAGPSGPFREECRLAVLFFNKSPVLVEHLYRSGPWADKTRLVRIQPPASAGERDSFVGGAHRGFFVTSQDSPCVSALRIVPWLLSHLITGPSALSIALYTHQTNCVRSYLL